MGVLLSVQPALLRLGSWHFCAHPLSHPFPGSCVHLGKLPTLFRRQDLIELRRGYGANRDEFSHEATLFGGEFLNLAVVVGHLRRGAKLFAVLLEFLPDWLRRLSGTLENSLGSGFLRIREVKSLGEVVNVPAPAHKPAPSWLDISGARL